MNVRWLILALAGAVVVATWSAVAIAYFFFDPSFALWATLVTIGALSLEGFMWVAAAVVGWSIFAKRRAALSRLKTRLFGGAKSEG